MPTPTELLIKNVPITETARVAQPQAVAMGMSMVKIQHLMQDVADEHAPHFTQGNQPLADGRTFRANDGVLFYRPRIRVSEREAPASGPDVRFLKDADGKVRLVFELEEDPDTSMPPEARPVSVRINEVVLRWNGGERRFNEPSLIDAAASQDGFKPAFAILVGTVLTSAEVESLNAVLSNRQSGARLDVSLTYGFWVDTVESPPPVTEPGPRPKKPFPGSILIPRGGRHLQNAPTKRVAKVSSGGAASSAANFNVMLAAQPAKVSASEPASTPKGVMLSTLLINKEALLKASANANRRTTVSNFSRQSFTRAIPFTFDPELDQNRLIFAAIRGSDSLKEAWTDTQFGPIRKAPFPNTVHYLPHEIRLAFNPEMGTAHVIPNLFRDEKEEIRVRVTLRVFPWFDPEKVVALSDHLYQSTGGALASPRVVAGGYQQATLRLLTAFPEQIRTLNQSDISIDLSGGVDLTLDLSLEFYRFVAELLTGPVGIVGEVRVLLQETPGAGAGAPPVRLERTIPVRLKFDTFANFPLAVTVENEAIRPDEVMIRNVAGGELNIGGCLPRLLQLDSNSVVPLQVFEARAEAVFPKKLGANESMSINIKPRLDSDTLLWNAVELSLTHLSLTQSAAQVLERVHEVAPSGTLGWKIDVECPVFLTPQLPDQFRNLFRVEVQINRPGFAAQQVALGANAAKASITMQRTLKDLMGDPGGGQLTFKYRVRNIYFEHAGKWSDEQNGEGSNLFVFPNPTAND